MNRYDNGKIYKVVDIGYNLCYIGSSCESLNKRMHRHRQGYKEFLKGKTTGDTRSVYIFKEYGLDNVKIELIENFPCNNKEELLKREGFHIQNNECVNRCLAGRNKLDYNKQRYEKKKEEILHKNKEYRDENINKIREIKRLYRENNKDLIREKKKKYREETRERLNEEHKEYYNKNKERYLKSVECECGAFVVNMGMRRHERTKKHIEFINNNS